MAWTRPGAPTPGTFPTGPSPQILHPGISCGVLLGARPRRLLAAGDTSITPVGINGCRGAGDNDLITFITCKQRPASASNALPDISDGLSQT